MSKKGRNIEIQKGPIEMDAQYTYKFKRQPEGYFNDVKNMSLRQSGKTLTKHEPKR